MQFTQFSQIAFTKSLMNLRSEASTSYLGYLWWVLEPAFLVAVFFFVFGVFLNRGGEEFVLFLICGHIPFNWFARTMSNCSNSILGGRELITHIPVSPMLFPVIVVIQDFYKSLAVILLMLIVVKLAGVPVTQYWLFIPLIIFLQLAFVGSVAVLGALLVPFLPDLRYLINTFIIAMMFASGIFYSYEEVLLPEHRELFLMNPMASLLKMYRDVILNASAPDVAGMLLIVLVSIVLLAIEFVILKKFRHSYSRLIS